MSNVTRKKTSCYCINARRAANYLTSHYDLALRPLGISVTQFSLISSLDKLATCSTSDLAVHMGLERTTVVRTIKPLLEKGFVVDTSGIGKRNHNYQLTEKGRHILAEARPLWKTAQDSLDQRVGADRMKALIDIVSDLTE